LRVFLGCAGPLLTRCSFLAQLFNRGLLVSRTRSFTLQNRGAAYAPLPGGCQAVPCMIMHSIVACNWTACARPVVMHCHALTGQVVPILEDGGLRVFSMGRILAQLGVQGTELSVCARPRPAIMDCDRGYPSRTALNRARCEVCHLPSARGMNPSNLRVK
jgi:hypothetical protein